ncbi:uncharacterized protein [Triticum aestivum]|uniref:uncharacterized protein n=1 Tax=Triticum aestivum TaxID=4565 RepID=UPI001D029390|nr:uncharacterized protein LOC123067359 [Triticum aestivum]
MKNRSHGLAQGVSFLLLLLLLLLDVTAQSEKNKTTVVSHLPRFHGPLPFSLETGYVQVDDRNGIHLFYYFMQSERSPAEDPVLLWLTGGPGCSAFSDLVHEIGLSFQTNSYNGGLPELVYRPDSWTKVANVIFLDSPVGAGFSYSATDQGYKSRNTKVVDQIAIFLTKSFHGKRTSLELNLSLPSERRRHSDFPHSTSEERRPPPAARCPLPRRPPPAALSPATMSTPDGRNRRSVTPPSADEELGVEFKDEEFPTLQKSLGKVRSPGSNRPSPQRGVRISPPQQVPAQPLTPDERRQRQFMDVLLNCNKKGNKSLYQIKALAIVPSKDYTFHVQFEHVLERGYFDLAIWIVESLSSRLGVNLLRLTLADFLEAELPGQIPRVREDIFLMFVGTPTSMKPWSQFSSEDVVQLDSTVLGNTNSL